MASNPSPLCRRHEQLLYLLCEKDLSNKEIALELGISLGTVRVYFSRLYRKLEFPKGEVSGRGAVRVTIWYWKRKIDTMCKDLVGTNA